jgi:hypothetical protein
MILRCTDLGPEFSIENWPAHYDTAQTALQELAAEKINPIPAYDVDGKLIKPIMYWRCLKGA